MEQILEREYTIKEVGTVLGIKQKAVRKRIAGIVQPKLHARKEGKEYRVPESALRAYIDSTYQQPQA